MGRGVDGHGGGRAQDGGRGRGGRGCSCEELVKHVPYHGVMVAV